MGEILQALGLVKPQAGRQGTGPAVEPEELKREALRGAGLFLQVSVKRVGFKC